MAWVFDKKYNSLPKQVDINTKDIEELRELIGTGFNVQGEWVSGGEYYEKDLVFYENNSYVCILDINPSEVNPKQDEEHFQAITDIPNLNTYASLNEDNTFTGMNTFSDIVMIEREGTNILLDTSGVEVTDSDTGVFVTPDDLQFRDSDQSITTFKSSDARFVRNEYDKTLNLLNVPNQAERTTNGITYKIENGVVLLSGTSTNNAFIDLPVNSIEIGTYTLKVFFTTSTSNNLNISLRGATNYITAIGLSTNYASGTTTGISNTIRIYIPNGTSTNTSISIMLVNGSTPPSTFTKYYGKIVHESDLGVLLWKNGSPNASFSPTGITLSKSIYDYKYIEIKFKPFWFGAEQTTQLMKFSVNSATTAMIVNACLSESSSASICGRKFEITSSTGISINNAYTDGNVDNDRCIPIEIYGTNEL